MEELQVLVGMVAKLPQMAMWVIALFWAYKVVVIGSAYGLIRFVVLKLHEYLMQQKTLPPTTREVRPMLDGMVIGGQLEPFMVQLRRLAGRGLTIESQYLHSQSVEWLRQAIDDKIAKDVVRAK